MPGPIAGPVNWDCDGVIGYVRDIDSDNRGVPRGLK